MHLSKSPNTFYLFIFFMTLLRLITAPSFALGVDEAHYVLYGLNLELSYFDHPPLVGWLNFISTAIFGINEFAARFFAIILGAITSIFLYNFMFRVTQERTLAFFSALSINASFMFNALFLMLMPETILFALIFPIILTTYDLIEKKSLKNYLLLGLLLGLAGLSKYTAVLFIVPIILYIIIKKEYKALLHVNTLFAIIIALVIISPVIIWNMQNDWMSFAFQSSHVAGKSTIHLEYFFQSLATQLGAYSPFLVPIAFYGLYKSFKSNNDLMLLSALFALSIFLFFAYASLYNRALPHWNALFYLISIPLGVSFFYQNYKKYTLFAIYFSLFISILLHVELLFKFISTPDYQSIHRDIYGFDTIMKKANSHIKENDAIAVTNWTLASRALYYNHPYKSDFFVIDDKFDQFDLWQKGSPLGKNLIFINTHFFKKNITKFARCDKVENVESFDIKLSHSTINSIDLIKCYNFQGKK